MSVSREQLHRENEMINEEMIANKVERAIERGMHPKYPLVIWEQAKGDGTLTLEFEGRAYRVTVEDLGEIPAEDEDEDE